MVYLPLRKPDYASHDSQGNLQCMSSRFLVNFNQFSTAHENSEKSGSEIKSSHYLLSGFSTRTHYPSDHCSSLSLRQEDCWMIHTKWQLAVWERRLLCVSWHKSTLFPACWEQRKSHEQLRTDADGSDWNNKHPDSLSHLRDNHS